MVHWKPEEADSGLALLRKAGHEVEVYSDQGGKGLAKFKTTPPEVVVISLERLPSQSRHFAHWFRTTQATSSIPIVFVGGVEEKVAIARALLPDALCCSWSRIRGAITQARKQRQTLPPTPGSGHDKALWRKFEIREGDQVLQLGGPDDLLPILGADLPNRVEVMRTEEEDLSQLGGIDTVLLFSAWLLELKQWFPQAAKLVAPKRALWICWPKKASKMESNVSQSAVMAYARAAGWSDLKICRVDDNWSGHMFRPKRNLKAKGS